MASKLITKKGFEQLKSELDHLWRVERPEVTKIVTWAASLGDRSENADYQYNKRRLREIDRRVRYLRKTLADIKVVEYDPQQEGKIWFGARVELEDIDGNSITFRIVGADEISSTRDYISVDSPMAKACLKKSVDDPVTVFTPSGTKEWYVVKIAYET